jgi:hypothetical protein
MTSLTVQPQVVADAAAKVVSIGSEIDAATAAAAGPTTNVVAAAGDEVSTAAANLFNSVGQQLQQAFKKVAAVNQQIAQGLGNANAAYLGAESAASNSLGALEAAAESLLFGPSSGGGTAAAFVGLFMGGSGLPIPSTAPGYMQGVFNYVAQNFALDFNNAEQLFTPEGLYPLTGVKSLPLNTSVNQGITILDNAINSQIASGNTVTVLGYSQSAIISSLVMEQIANGQWPFPNIPTSAQLSFTLLGNEMNPNGGALERFVGLNLPSLGIMGYGATPPNTPYPTNIYTLEYDGFADFPQYPINILSDLNAVAGIAFVHGTYPMINPSALPVGDSLITLPGSAALTGTGATNYYMITQPNLPLLEPLRLIPVIGNPLADLVQPDLSVLVNLGYGSTTQGWSPGPANVPTPFGVIPQVSPNAIGSALAAGPPQGMNAFMSDVNLEAPVVASNMSPASLTSMISSAGTGAAAGLAPLAAAVSSPGSFIQSLQAANTAIAGDISGGLANAYAVALPTADIANALAIAMPSYDVNLFLSGVQQTIGGDPVGGLIYAFGAPVAADTGIVTLAAGFELDAIIGAL